MGTVPEQLMETSSSTGDHGPQSRVARGLALALVAAVVVRLLFMVTFEGYVLDQTTRVLDVAHWDHGRYPFFGTRLWPDGNYLLPAVALKLMKGLTPFWSTRWLYLLVALSNIPLLHWVVLRGLGPQAAKWSAWALALSPFHILLSLNGATSEPAYVSAALLGIVAVQSFTREPRIAPLVYAGLAVGLATMFRFDAVLWGPIFAYCAWCGDDRFFPGRDQMRRWWVWPVVGIFASLYPALLVWRWWTLTGDPMWAMTVANQNSQQFFDAGRHPVWGVWPYRILVAAFWQLSSFVTLSPIVAALSFMGLAHLLRARRSLTIAVPFVLISAWLTYASFQATIIAQWRYGLILHVLLVACIYPGWLALKRVAPRFRLSTLVFASLLGAVSVQILASYASARPLGLISRQFFLVNLIQRSPYAGGRLVRWLSENTTPEAPALLLACAQRNIVVVLTSDQLKQTKRLVDVPLFIPDKNGLAYTKAEVARIFERLVQTASYVVADGDCAGIGYRDGAGQDLIDGEGKLQHGVILPNASLILDRREGSLHVYRIQRGR